MTYVIALPCVDVKDKACIEECPVDCIYEGERMLYIHPDECVDCGACEPVCPVEAIFYEDDTPEQWKDYYNANVDFFNDLVGLHVNGRARIITADAATDYGLSEDEPASGRRAERWVVVSVEEAYIHCSKNIPLLKKEDRRARTADRSVRPAGAGYFTGEAGKSEPLRTSPPESPSTLTRAPAWPREPRP